MSNLQIKYQIPDDLLWSRSEFYKHAALPRHICIFGHTPTPGIHNNGNCSIWVDVRHNDKTNIDCGCVHGGALAALRLDDGETFYVRSKQSSQKKYSISALPPPYTYSAFC